MRASIEGLDDTDPRLTIQAGIVRLAHAIGKCTPKGTVGNVVAFTVVFKMLLAFL